MQLTEEEAAFRMEKSDLQIRPIWHQKEERVLSHILVCFLAYVFVDDAWPYGEVPRQHNTKDENKQIKNGEVPKPVKVKKKTVKGRKAG